MARKKLPVVLRGDEPERLLDVAKSSRDRLIFAISLLAGLRISEVLHLRIEHLDFEGRTLEVHEGKGGKDRNLPLSEKLIEPLKDWIRDRREGFLFISERTGRTLTPRAVQRSIKKAATRAQIARNVTPHKLRHTFATRLLNRGANLREVQDLMGHANLGTTEIYLHTETERLRGAIDRL